MIKNEETLYRCTISSFLTKDTNLVWPDEHDIDAEIKQFRDVVYPRWCGNHPDRVKHYGGTNRPMRTADFYIDGFCRNINEVAEEAEKYGWPWMWMVDDLTKDGKLFAPHWILLGDSRIFDITGKEAVQVTPFREKDKGKDCKTSTRLNTRYRVVNRHYSNTCSINVEELIAYYFRVHPPVKDGITLEASHIYKFDPTESCIYNNNLLNVTLATKNDNCSTQVLLANGNIAKLLLKEEAKQGVPIEIDDPFRAMLEAVKDPRLDSTVEFERSDQGGIKRITVRNSRHIGKGLLGESQKDIETAEKLI